MEISSIQPSSLANRVWDTPTAARDVAAAGLRQSLGISQELADILASRGMEDPGLAREFLSPSESQLLPPMLMLGMGDAVQRIISAVTRYEKILVVGDYDVDGTASASIFYNYMRRLGAHIQFYIPHRLTDGYGLNRANIARYKQWGVDLLVSTDQGSTEVEGAMALEREGIELIIADHHQLGREKPRCVAMINPQQKDCPYPFKGLSAAGVVYKLIQALDEALTAQNFWDTRGVRRTSPSYYLDLVALATVADMSPLVGENRTLVRLGLEAINSNPRPGVSGLIKECRVRGDVSPTSISFKLAPKINALGRIGDPGLAVQLFNCHSHTEARKLARVLVSTNQKRQVIERRVFDLAMDQVESNGGGPGCVLAGEDWHPGVIGSIATRVSFSIKKPTVVLTLQDKPHAVGSARGWNGFNVLAALGACESLLDRFGGHPAAAGLSMQQSQVGAFAKGFNEAVERVNGQNVPVNEPLRIDAWVRPEAITETLLDEVARLSPFGYCNPEPVLAMRNVRMENLMVFHKRHLKFRLMADEAQPLEAVAWEKSDWAIAPDTRYDVAFMPQRQLGPRGTFTQLKILDCIPVG